MDKSKFKYAIVKRTWKVEYLQEVYKDRILYRTNDTCRAMSLYSEDSNNREILIYDDSVADYRTMTHYESTLFADDCWS